MNKNRWLKEKLYKGSKASPFSPRLRIRYIKLRSKLSTMVEQVKANFYNRFIPEESDPRKYWNAISRSCGLKETSLQQITKKDL